MFHGVGMLSNSADVKKLQRSKYQRTRNTQIDFCISVKKMLADGLAGVNPFPISQKIISNLQWI